MGYYTTFDLSVRNGEVSDEIKNKLKEINPDYFEDTHSVDELFEGWWNAKWYDFEDDMLELSEAFPDTVFELAGEGEESQDLWRCYFLNGKVQREQAEITIGEFNPEKLI